MSAPAPLVSIITPSFNQGRFLGATLRSVGEQDYHHVEHIVMDGGSTDGSIDLLRRWAESHPIQWRSGDDAGQAAAIQSGVEAAHGEIITWLNSDDTYLDPSVISDVVALFEGGVAAVTGAGWYISESGARARPIPVYPQHLRYDALRHVDWILQPATFVKREVFLRFPIDTTLTYAFDWDLFIRMSREVTFKPTDRQIAGYRIHPGGKTVSGATARKREVLEVTGRYNGRTSVHYLLLLALVTSYRVAAGLPRPISYVARGAITAVARLSLRLPGGKGLQF